MISPRRRSTLQGTETKCQQPQESLEAEFLALDKASDDNSPTGYMEPHERP